MPFIFNGIELNKRISLVPFWLPKYDMRIYYFILKKALLSSCKRLSVKFSPKLAERGRIGGAVNA
jgi:hypothetical protein